MDASIWSHRRDKIVLLALFRFRHHWRRQSNSDSRAKTTIASSDRLGANASWASFARLVKLGRTKLKQADSSRFKPRRSKPRRDKDLISPVDAIGLANDRIAVMATVMATVMVFELRNNDEL